MGLDVEEMRVGIERKYEDMLNTLKQKLDRLKHYFNSILDNLKVEFNQQMINEKQQNLENLKKLESILQSAMELAQGERKEKSAQNFMTENETKLIALQDLFTFVKEFKEESYSLILSRLADLNTFKMKKQLDDFVGQNLNRLYDAPKAFPTELYRFFLNNQELYEEDDDKRYGTTLSLTSILPEEISFKNTLNTISPELEFNRNRTPLVKLLSDNYVLISGRRDFKVFKYKWANSVSGKVIPKSRFYRQKSALPEKNFDYELVFSSMDRAIEKEKYRLEQERDEEYLKIGFDAAISPDKQGQAGSFNYTYNNKYRDLEIAAKLKQMKDDIRPGYHCVCHMKNKKSGKQYLLLGGNHNVRNCFLKNLTWEQRIFKYEIMSENEKEIDDIVYKGVTDFKDQNKDLPRQKINGIYQYKNTTHVVCVMSYGYVAVVDIDVNGMNDVS